MKLQNEKNQKQIEEKIQYIITEIDDRFMKKKKELLNDGTKSNLEIIDTLIKYNNVMKAVYSAKYPDMAIELKYMFYMTSIQLTECREYIIKGNKVKFI